MGSVGGWVVLDVTRGVKLVEFELPREKYKNTENYKS